MRLGKIEEEERGGVGGGLGGGCGGLRERERESIVVQSTRYAALGRGNRVLVGVLYSSEPLGVQGRRRCVRAACNAQKRHDAYKADMVTFFCSANPPLTVHRPSLTKRGRTSVRLISQFIC